MCHNVSFIVQGHCVIDYRGTARVRSVFPANISANTLAFPSHETLFFSFISFNDSLLPSYSSFLYPLILRYLVSFNFHFPSLYSFRRFYSLFRFFFFPSLAFVFVYYSLSVFFIATMENFALDLYIYTRFQVLVVFYIFSSFSLSLCLGNRLPPFIRLFRFDRRSIFRFRFSTQSF